MGQQLLHPGDFAMSEHASTTPPHSGPVGLLLSADLIFTAKITGTAQALKQRVLVAGNTAKAAALIAQESPAVVFIDLAAGELSTSEALIAFRALAPETPFIAFGSHVDTAALDAASAAGCDDVMPRSKFTNVLPDLIRRYLGDSNEFTLPRE
jgi:DNA-binding NarL/FixJ family response regulator